MLIDGKHGGVILFGYGKFGRNVAQTLKREGIESILLIESDRENYSKALQDGFSNAKLMDITDDANLEKIAVAEDDQLVCLMDDDHLNVFLVLSLKALYPHNNVLALSDSIHATSKLKMAGANKVIDLYSVSANRIYNILRKPITTHFLDGFTNSNHEYSFREIHIPENSFLHEKRLEDIDFRRYGIIFIGMIDVELGNSFIFVTTGLEHKLDAGDVIVCIGHSEDLDRFEEIIKEPEEECRI